ncbi:MAG: TonB family protein [Bdellovibrionales bacterium]|nr:TonB family protein [Bdellovibrionales bacterium]
MKFLSLLTLSLLIHFLIWKGLSLPFRSAPPLAQKPIEVEYLTADQAPEPRVQKTFVGDVEISDRLEDALKNLKKRAKYLSKKKQRVHEEQIAQLSGSTKNRNSPLNKKSNVASSEAAQKKAKQDLQERARGELAIPKERSLVGDNQVIGEPSTLGEYIPNVKTGGFTALNTDQFIYYTFYLRVNERIRNHWVNHVREFIDRTPLGLLAQSARRPQETRIEVLLSKEGKYIETIIHKGSDFELLDLAAVKAFAEAAPLPNPPEEMVEKDGKIHLHYSLYVIFDPAHIAQTRR